MTETLSAYQTAIINDIDRGSGHTAVNAVAGAGKTWTICKGAITIPKIYSVFMGAFGADIVKVLKTKGMERNVTIQTYNALGWGIANRNSRAGRLVLDPDKTHQTLQHMVLGAREEDKESWDKYQRSKGPIKRLVSMLKGECIFRLDDVIGRAQELVAHHAIELPEDQDFYQNVVDTYQKCLDNELVYDFDDQIFQVLRKDMPIPAFDYVFVDEFQDTNDMQSKLMQEACRQGRFFGVGDPDQAIYGFRGATKDAFGKFVKQFKAKELPLSICYRCPKAVIAEAKKIVPRIEAASWAREGIVDTITTDDFRRRVSPGDFVLCRTINPLIRHCLGNIRDGIPAYIFGRDIGGDIEYLIDKVCRRSYFIPIKAFKDDLQAYVMKKMQAYNALHMENLAIGLDDKYKTILAFMEEVNTVGNLITKIRSVFSDNKDRNAIMYMSIHKAKGLECENNVFLLRPDLLPHPRAQEDWQIEEERRLQYVAITRTKSGFFYVLKERGEK